MLVFQKNSFKTNDSVTNAGFACCVVLVLTGFLFVPIVLIEIMQITLGPFTKVALPSLVILPGLCLFMYFYGRRGRLCKKFKLQNWKPKYIGVSFASSFFLMFAMSAPLRFYQQILEFFNISRQPEYIKKMISTSDDWTVLLIAFGVVVLAPISEELVFRRFMFGYLAPRCGAAVALVITSFIFAAIHMSVYNLPALFLLGAGFQIIYLHYKSLYPAILMHFFNNAVAMYVILFFPKLAQ